jgi:Circularly permutated YpsA SLOG family
MQRSSRGLSAEAGVRRIAALKMERYLNRYPLTPLPAVAVGAPDKRESRQVAEQYRARTLKNVQDSDGTVIILFIGTLSGGTLLTQKLCVREKKPFIALDAQAIRTLRAADTVARFIEEHEIEALNVAGPRLSGWPAGYRYALGVVGAVISNL